MATATESQTTGEAEETVYPLTSDVYFQMVESGLIPTDRRVSLWDGRLYEKMAKTASHAAVHNACLTALSRRLGPGYSLGTENPVRLDQRHTPLPDLVVLRGEPLAFQDL